MRLWVNGEEKDASDYANMHWARIAWTLEKIKKYGKKSIVEIGSNPWVMTAEIIDDPDLQLLATVSAEESLVWPDDIEPMHETREILTGRQNYADVKTYVFNVERHRTSIDETPELVLACEIIEHLIRSPHVMLLNINDWLSVGGLLIITTPNGCQMVNPLTRSPRMPMYRSHCYERHSYVYTLSTLIELVEKCGFIVIESGHSSPYPCSGFQYMRKALASVPGRYFSDKFHRMLYIVAKKSRNVESLSKCPSIYVPSMDWEYIDAST